MPFRDGKWENFQRDCDFFPAYTDYIFGVDTRPEVADEPGLHPLIYDPSPPPPPPPRRLYGLPPADGYSVAHDVVRNVARVPHNFPNTTSQDSPAASVNSQELPQMLLNSQHSALLRHESSAESLLPTPTPAPRTLSMPNPPIALLRPGELAADGQYSFIPQRERMFINKNVTQAHAILNSDASPAQKAKAMDYLRSRSQMIALKKQEWQSREAAMLEVEMRAEEEWKMNDETCQKAAGGERTAYEADITERQPAVSVPAEPEYAIRDISQLPAYVQSRLSQLWICMEVVTSQAPLADPGQLDIYRQAQQYMTAFKESVPPNGRPWVGKVVDKMLRLHEEGGDPLTVLQTMSNA